MSQGDADAVSLIRAARCIGSWRDGRTGLGCDQKCPSLT